MTVRPRYRPDMNAGQNVARNARVSAEHDPRSRPQLHRRRAIGRAEDGARSLRGSAPDARPASSSACDHRFRNVADFGRHHRPLSAAQRAADDRQPGATLRLFDDMRLGRRAGPRAVVRPVAGGDRADHRRRDGVGDCVRQRVGDSDGRFTRAGADTVDDGERRRVGVLDRCRGDCRRPAGADRFPLAIGEGRLSDGGCLLLDFGGL